MKIIFAQGNPEPDYINTRHNVGFLALNALAEKINLKWNNQPKFHASIAEGSVNGEKILLVKPTTFYNETGTSARKIVDFYKSNPSTDLIVIHDDLALPFGTIRVRVEGSDGGNNGIKSINSHLDPNYSRIRIGTDNEMRVKMNDDAAFVLAKFNAEESKLLDEKIIPHTIQLVNDFINNQLNISSHKTI